VRIPAIWSSRPEIVLVFSAASRLASPASKGLSDKGNSPRRYHSMGVFARAV
jgi:hypothetical protein